MIMKTGPVDDWRRLHDHGNDPCGCDPEHLWIGLQRAVRLPIGARSEEGQYRVADPARQPGSTRKLVGHVLDVIDAWPAAAFVPRPDLAQS